MRRRIEVRRAARIAIDKASAWWEVNRSAAQIDFDEEMARALETIRDWPGIGEIARWADHHDVRRLLVGSIEYFVYYRASAPRAARAAEAD